jgi:exopolyphosphatase / guanosine-5'-triphosphate,3'-diphosphate pyrophosphatase
MRGAAIDLGSNSFICFVFEKTDSGEMVSLDDKIVLTRLSEGVDETKMLSPQALERAEKAFQEFTKMFKKHQVTDIRAVATSAARDAKNQKEFLSLANKYNIPVQILSGDEEAQLTFNGVQEYFKNNEGMIIDIGGGSTEFVWVSNGKMKDRVSLDVGVVRFSERYLKSSDFKTKEEELRQGIKNEFAKNKKLQDFKNIKFNTFLAVSGTPTSAASVLLNEFDVDKLDGFKLAKNDFNKMIESYGYLNLDERLARFPFVELKRADVLPTGILILQESLNFFNFESYKVSTRGIRHGLARFMCGFDSGIN